MKRRSFLQGTLVTIVGSLLIGKESIKQTFSEKQKDGLTMKMDENGNFTVPGFFTVFVDGKEGFRMSLGDKIVAERNCHVVAFRGLELASCMNFYLMDGDSLEVN